MNWKNGSTIKIRNRNLDRDGDRRSPAAGDRIAAEEILDFLELGVLDGRQLSY